jgi:hypothetical protein
LSGIQKGNAMRTATFKFYEMTKDGLKYTIITRPLLMVFNGGILVEMEGKPQGKCIASENVISIK